MLRYKPYGLEAHKAILDEENLKARLRCEEVGHSRNPQLDLSARFGKLDTSRTVLHALKAINRAYSKQDVLRFYTFSVTLTIFLEITDCTSWPNDKERGNIKPSAAICNCQGGFWPAHLRHCQSPWKTPRARINSLVPTHKTASFVELTNRISITRSRSLATRTTADH